MQETVVKNDVTLKNVDYLPAGVADSLADSGIHKASMLFCRLRSASGLIARIAFGVDASREECEQAIDRLARECPHLSQRACFCMEENSSDLSKMDLFSPEMRSSIEE